MDGKTALGHELDQSADEPWQFGNRYPDPTPEQYRSQTFCHSNSIRGGDGQQTDFTRDGKCIAKNIHLPSHTESRSRTIHRHFELSTMALEHPSKSTPDSPFSLSFRLLHDRGTPNWMIEDTDRRHVDEKDRRFVCSADRAGSWKKPSTQGTDIGS